MDVASAEATQYDYVESTESGFPIQQQAGYRAG